MGSERTSSTLLAGVARLGLTLAGALLAGVLDDDGAVAGLLAAGGGVTDDGTGAGPTGAVEAAVGV